MSLFDRLARWLDLDDFDKRDKTAFVVLGCVTVLILVLWFAQLKSNITGSLYGGLSLKQIQQNSNQVAASSEADLKSKDTDGDGLSDWDEMNIYHTSPYLADSDSDGINDYEEIQKGTDPNCPTGQQCTGNLNQGTTSSLDNPALSNLLDQTVSDTVTPQITSQVKPATGQTNSSSPLTTEEKDALKKAIGSSKDPAVLRSFLLASGADKTYVDSLSDKDLQKVIDEILK